MTTSHPKVVLITGSSSGFGRDTAETLASAGHTVFATMRDTAGRNQAHADALIAEGIHVVELDVTDEISVKNGVASVLAKTGRLDVLVNNAGIGAAGVSEAFTTNQVRALFDVNVFGIQRMMQAILPTFRSQGDGLVINIGSILGRVVFPFFGLYGATKFAVEALTESYHLELSQLGVDVVLVQPSNYPTSVFSSAILPSDAKTIEGYGAIGGIPNKMVQTLLESFEGETAPNPHDVAEAIAKLVTEAKGTRSIRTVVGQSFGTDAINHGAAEVQVQLLAALGLGFLAGISAVPENA